MQEKREQQAHERGESEKVLAPLSDRTLWEYRKKAELVAVREPSTQNERRLMTALDPRTSLSIAAVLTAAYPPGQPYLMTNTDVTSILLGERQQTAYTNKESIPKLKTEAKSVSVTQKEHKHRGTSIMATTTAAGELVCVIAIIKDEAFKILKKIPVSHCTR